MSSHDGWGAFTTVLWAARRLARPLSSTVREVKSIKMCGVSIRNQTEQDRTWVSPVPPTLSRSSEWHVCVWENKNEKNKTQHKTRGQPKSKYMSSLEREKRKTKGKDRISCYTVYIFSSRNRSRSSTVVYIIYNIYSTVYYKKSNIIRAKLILIVRSRIKDVLQ